MKKSYIKWWKGEDIFSSRWVAVLVTEHVRLQHCGRDGVLHGLVCLQNTDYSPCPYCLWPKSRTQLRPGLQYILFKC